MDIKEFKKNKFAELNKNFENDMPIQDRHILWGFIELEIIDDLVKLFPTEQARSEVEPEVMRFLAESVAMLYKLTTDIEEWLQLAKYQYEKAEIKDRSVPNLSSIEFSTKLTSEGYALMHKIKKYCDKNLSQNV